MGRMQPTEVDRITTKLIEGGFDHAHLQKVPLGTVEIVNDYPKCRMCNVFLTPDHVDGIRHTDRLAWHVHRQGLLNQPILCHAAPSSAARGAAGGGTSCARADAAYPDGGAAHLPKARPPPPPVIDMATQTGASLQDTTTKGTQTVTSTFMARLPPNLQNPRQREWQHGGTSSSWQGPQWHEWQQEEKPYRNGNLYSPGYPARRTS